MQHHAYFSLEKIKQYQEGDESIFDEIFMFYKDDIYRMAYQYFQNEEDAKEIVQETFLQVSRKIDQLEAPEAFFVWLSRIAFRRCLMLSRKRKAETESDHIEFQDSYHVVDMQYTMVDQEQMKQASSLIQGALDQMKEKQRVTGYLRFYEELSIKEIAEILNVPEGTIMSRLSKIRTDLCQVLQQKGFTRETCLLVVATPNLVGFYHAFQSYQVELSIGTAGAMIKDMKKSIKKPRKPSLQPKNIFTIVATGAGVCAGIASLVFVANAIGSSTQNDSQSTDQTVVEHKITSIEYTQGWTNTGFELDVKTDASEYDTIVLNNQEDLYVIQNGSYQVQVWKDDSIIARKDITIDNIDLDPPVLHTVSSNAKEVIFRLKDELSGVDFENIQINKTNGVDCEIELDEDQGLLTLRNTKQQVSAYTVQVYDQAGNEQKVEISFAKNE